MILSGVSKIELIEEIKGLVHPKMKMMSLMDSPSCRPKPVQDILDSVRELSVPPLEMYVQKGNTDIIKVVHVTSVG